MDKNIEIFDRIINRCNRFERKGKTVPYTSANGHMFSLINKAGEIGFRFSKTVQEAYFKKYNTTFLMSHGAKMKGYILITKDLLNNEDLLVDLLNESYDYVMSLDPK